MSSPLVVSLFGPMQVLVHGHPLPQLRSRKSLWLLALLALRSGRPAEREWLAETLWPDTDPSRSAANLRVVLSELRHALGREADRLQSPSRHLLALDLTGADVDLRLFDAALASREPSALEQAVALYKGPLLEGCPEEWVLQDRAAREQDCLGALQTLADAALATGDTAGAVGHYRRAIALDPWREAARRGLMQALAQGGDGNAARETYQDFVRLLRRDDPRATPDRETTALYDRLRTEARRRSAPPIAAVQPPTAPKTTGYLPHPLTDLVGRDDERLDLADGLRRSRLVTLTGPGGIGKTRLAVEVAAESAPEFADGVWLIALEALSPHTAQIASQIADVLGLHEDAARPLLDSLTDHLRPKRLLLVLDNCEHLLEASARAADHLLRECAGLRILATSREALGITGETLWPVAALATPDLAHLPTGRTTLVRVLSGFESVQLFMQRAQAIHKTLSLTPDNAHAVARICARLEGIPLALELAAARVKVLTLAQIATRLDDHLALLTGGSRVGPSRQQTVRATLDWSWHLLTDAERLLLARLSVFSGGWTAEAAESICADTDTRPNQMLDRLASLADKSLVVIDPSQGRGRLLETIRQYAAERLQERGETEAMRIKHRDHFLDLVEHFPPPNSEDKSAVRPLEAEHDNLRAALSCCETDPQGAETGLRLASALWTLWVYGGYYSEGRATLGRALARKEAQEATVARGHALKGAALLADRQGDYVAARSLYEQSLALFQTIDNNQETGTALGNLNDLAHRQNDLAAAQTYYEQARAHHERNIALFQQQGQKRPEAVAFNHLGILAAHQGDHALAQDYNERGLSVSQEIGDQQLNAFAFLNLAALAYHQGDYPAAQSYLEHGLNAFQELDDRSGVAAVFHNLGSIACRQEDYAAAQSWLGQALTLFQELGDQKWVVRTCTHLALASRHLGDYEAAQSLQQQSLLLCQELGDQAEAAEGLEGMAAILLAQSQTRRAVQLWAAAHSLRQKIGAPLSGEDQPPLDRDLAQARAALGETAFTTAWESGHALSWDRALADALNSLVE